MAEAGEDAARAAVLKAGQNPKWAAIYAWCEQNKHKTFKLFSDRNGELEIELTIERKKCERLEAEIKRFTDGEK